MKILRAIIISSLTIPALVFFLFFALGLAFLVAELISNGIYSNGWLGILFAGVTYSCMAALISTIPTIVIGFLISLVAKKYAILNGKVILVGATIIGGLFLGISASLFFKESDPKIFLWYGLAGGCGGLLNGFVFFWRLKLNLTFERVSPEAG